MKITKSFLYSVFMLLSTITYSQQMICQWLSYSQTGPSNVSKVCIDVNGNSFTLGSFKKIDIQGNALLSNPQDKFNVFLFKMDTTGNLVWLKHIAQGNNCKGKSMILTSEGNLIITGEFGYSISICDTMLNEDEIVGEFIAKLDQDGNCVWIKYVDFCGSFGPMPVVTDSDDNIYLMTAGSTTIDGFSSDGKTVITKFDKNGHIIWMKPTSITISNTYGTEINSVIMGSNKLIVGGYYKDTIDFAGNTYISGIEMSIDPYTGDTLYFSSTEALLGVIDSSGVEIKAVTFSGVGEISLEAVTMNDVNDIFVSGKYLADSLHINSFCLHGGNGYLARFTSDIELTEAKNIVYDKIYGAISNDNFTFYAHQNWDYMYIKIFDFNCNYVDSKIMGEDNLQPEYPKSLARFPDNDILLGGGYFDELIIDSLVAPGLPLSDSKLFVARFASPMTDLYQLKKDDEIVLYPNPITDKLFIEADRLRYMELYDINGSLMVHNICDNEISFRGFNKGIYFLKIFTDNFVITRKLIKL